MYQMHALLVLVPKSLAILPGTAALLRVIGSPTASDVLTVGAPTSPVHAHSRAGRSCSARRSARAGLTRGGRGYEQYEERVREQLDDEHGINVDNVHAGVP